MTLAHKAVVHLKQSFRGLETTLLYWHDLQSLPELHLESGCEFRIFDGSNFDLLNQVSPDDPSGEMYRRRLERGDRCYFATADGRPAHFSWAQSSGTHRLLEAGCSIPVEPGEFWIYHCHTSAWARGRRLYPYALSRILHDYRDVGCRRAWIYTTAGNASSQHGIERAGFVFERRLRALYFAGTAIPLPGSW
jgi:hypothetical protein